MSLLDTAKENFVMLDKKTVQDEHGDFVVEYVEGAKFSANLIKRDSTEARIAMSQGVKNVYTLMTSKALVLESKDVFKREKDGKVFRVSSDGADMATPEGAGLNLRKVSCEEWVIPA